MSTEMSQVPLWTKEHNLWGDCSRSRAQPEGLPRIAKQSFYEFVLAAAETQSAEKSLGFTFHLRRALRYFNTFWHIFLLAVVYNNPLEA